MRVDIYNTDKKYNIIYADPPWHYDFGKSSSRYVETHYPTLDIKSFNSNFFTNYIIYSCVQKKRTPATIKKKGKVSNMNLEDRVDNYLRLYIQKDIPITRGQADEINEYKCELRNRIDKAIEILTLCDSKCSREVIEILKGKSE